MPLPQPGRITIRRRNAPARDAMHSARDAMHSARDAMSSARLDRGPCTHESACARRPTPDHQSEDAGPATGSVQRFRSAAGTASAPTGRRVVP